MLTKLDCAVSGRVVFLAALSSAWAIAAPIVAAWLSSASCVLTNRSAACAPSVTAPA